MEGAKASTPAAVGAVKNGMPIPATQHGMAGHSMAGQAHAGHGYGGNPGVCVWDMGRITTDP